MGMLNWEEVGLHDEVEELGGIVKPIRPINFDLIDNGKIIRYYKLEMEIKSINKRFYFLNIFNKEERDRYTDELQELKLNNEPANFVFREYREFKDAVLAR